MPREDAALSFTPSTLEALCKALGDTDDGLVGSEIGQLLGQSRIVDIDPSATKWRRLYNALAAAQNAANAATPILNFVHHALAPARFAGLRQRGEDLRRAANVSLLFLGLEMRDDGKYAHARQASTLRDAEARARDLYDRLRERGVHGDVLRFCRAELLEDNYFHAVLEATKSVAQKVRDRSGLTTDGASLYQTAFGGDSPSVRVNAMRTESERGEQRGFMNLLIGMAGVFRNTAAHEARIMWAMPVEDALDLFALASYAHRRIDRATTL